MSQTVNHTITGDLINFVLPWYNLCSWFSCLVSVTNPTWCTINMSVRSKRWKNGCHTDSLRFLAYSFSISTLDGSSWKSMCFISHNKREKEEKERSYFTQDQDPTQKGSNKHFFFFLFSTSSVHLNLEPTLLHQHYSLQCKSSVLDIL